MKPDVLYGRDGRKCAVTPPQLSIPALPEESGRRCALAGLPLQRPPPPPRPRPGSPPPSLRGRRRPLSCRWPWGPRRAARLGDRTVRPLRRRLAWSGDPLAGRRHRGCTPRGWSWCSSSRAPPAPRRDKEQGTALSGRCPAGVYGSGRQLLSARVSCSIGKRHTLHSAEQPSPPPGLPSSHSSSPSSRPAGDGSGCAPHAGSAAGPAGGVFLMRTEGETRASSKDTARQTSAVGWPSKTHTQQLGPYTLPRPPLPHTLSQRTTSQRGVSAAMRSWPRPVMSRTRQPRPSSKFLMETGGRQRRDEGWREAGSRGWAAAGLLTDVACTGGGKG